MHDQPHVVEASMDPLNRLLPGMFPSWKSQRMLRDTLFYALHEKAAAAAKEAYKAQSLHSILPRSLLPSADTLSKTRSTSRRLTESPAAPAPLCGEQNDEELSFSASRLPDADDEIEITLEVHGGHTEYGESYYVVGSLPELGEWDASRAVRMECSQYPLWRTTGLRVRPRGAKQVCVCSASLILHDLWGAVHYSE
jgi:hypothetical protein